MEPVTLAWPGGEDDFLLRLGELEALDDQTSDGVLDFRYRLSQGTLRGSMAYAPVKIAEVIACLRLGLVGAGMERKDAARKVTRAFEDGDISELALASYMIISHSLQGKEHDDVGAQEGEPTAEGDPPESSSPAYTEAPS